MTELSDQSLLAHWYRHRNAEAFHVLAARHARMVYATALRVLRDAQAAEDVSQESFLALAQAKRPPSRNVAAWLHRTAYHAALDVIRSGKRRHTRDVEYAAMQPHATHTTWDDMRGLVDEAVASLPEAWREPLVRHFFEQESHAAIAAALGIPRQTVTHRIGKGIEQVRQQLKDRGVIVPAGALLAALIQENSASALPMSAAAGIGRIALAATPSVWAVLATYTTGAAFKTAAAVLLAGAVATVVVVGGGPEGGPVQSPQVAAVTSAPPASVSPEPEAILTAAKEVGNANSGDVASGSPVLAAALPGDSELASISGVVLLPDGKPLARANVRLVDATATGPHRPDFRPLVQADDVGRFEFTDLPPAEYAILVTEASDQSSSLADEVARVKLALGERRNTVEVIYGTEGDLTVTGIVQDSEGIPLANLEIMLASRLRRQAVSDRDGHFVLKYLPEGIYNIAISPINTGFNESWLGVSAGDQDVRFVLHYAGAVSGRVIDGRTRKPIPQFEVAHMPGHKTEFNEGAARFKKQIDDPEGLFTFGNFQSGEGTVAVRAPGYETALAPVTVPEKETLSGLVFELTPTAGTAIAGKVVTEGGVPIAGAKIYTEKPEQPRIREHQKVVAETDDLGMFIVADALPGQGKIYAWHPGFVPTAGEASDDSSITLLPACSLAVEVYSSGVPLAKANVSAGSLGYGTTDSAGRAVIEELPSGEIKVSASLELGRSRSEVVLIEPGKENTLRIELAPAGASVDGTVYDNDGAIGDGVVRLVVETTAGTETLTRPILPEGVFHFPDVPLGTAYLTVTTTRPQRQGFVEDISLERGKTTELHVDVTAKAWLRGTVSGLADDKKASTLILRGDINEVDAVEKAENLSFDLRNAWQAIVKSGNFEVPLDRPGTYTILLMVHPGIMLNEFEHYEYRVVEVPESGELNVDFSLPQ